MADRHTRVTVNETSSQEGDCEPNSTVCGLRDVLDRIGDTWSVLVIIQLRLHGRRRFGQLLRSVEGISQRMLTVTLRRLQRDGLISRTVLDTSPPQVEYALTGTGESLTVVLRQLVDWATDNRESIAAARQRWDRGAGRMSQSDGDMGALHRPDRLRPAVPGGGVGAGPRPQQSSIRRVL